MKKSNSIINKIPIFIFIYCCLLSPVKVYAQESSATSSLNSDSSEDIQQLSKREKKKKAKEYYKSGMKYMDEENYVAAQREFEKAMDVYPYEQDYFEALSKARSGLKEYIGIPKSADKKEIKAKVIEVVPKAREIVLNIGNKEGLKKGQWLNIYRGGNLILAVYINNPVDANNARIILPKNDIELIEQDDDVEVDFARGLFVKGVNFFDDTDYKRATESFAEVAAYKSGHDASLRNIGLSFIFQGELQKAAIALQEAQNFNPYSLVIKKDLAYVYASVAPDKSLKTAEDVLEDKFKETDIHFLRGLLLARNGDWDSGMEDFMFVYNVNRDDVFNVMMLALAMLNRQEYSRGAERLGDIDMTQLSDKLKACVVFLESVCSFESGDVVTSESLFDRAVLLAPEMMQYKSAVSEGASLGEFQEYVIKYILSESIVSYFSNTRLSSYKQSPVIARHAKEVILQRDEFKAPPAPPPSKFAKPMGFSGTITSTFEHYNRDPGTSYPVSGTHITEKIELERTMHGKDVSFEAEGYRNHWDSLEPDYYKLNVEDDNDEVDVGKFSSSHFADLVKHSEITHGVRYWRKVEKEAKEADLDRLIESVDTFDEGGLPNNFASMYEEEFIDKQFFKAWEFTTVAGISKESINVGEKKEENYETHWSTGQFRRDVYAFRMMTEVTSNTELGISYMKVKDDLDSALTSATTTPINNDGVGIDLNFTLFEEKLEGSWEMAWSQYDPDQHAEDDAYSDVASLFDLDYEITDDIDFGYTRKRVGKNFKIEGASQTQDKLTDTYTVGYARSSSKAWTLDSFDLTYETAKTNLDKDQSTRKRYRTINPKIAFTIINDAELSFDYKMYNEWWTSLSTVYKTKTLKTDLDYEWEKTKTTFKPSYTFERKNDSSGSPTDEKKKDYSFTIENTYFDKLSVDLSISKERKTYVGASNRAYTEKEYSVDIDYELTEQWDLGFEYSFKDRLNTSSENYQLETLKLTASYESESGDDSLDISYEHKNNPYEPEISSAYNRDYFKVEWVRDF